MATVTKKELIDHIADKTNQKRVIVKKIVQAFLDEVITELGSDNRLEFRDFGVFEVKYRRARKAQNPKTLEPVQVPPKRTVKFKVGRRMKEALLTDPPTNATSNTSTPDTASPATPTSPSSSSALGTGSMNISNPSNEG